MNDTNDSRQMELNLGPRRPQSSSAWKNERHHRENCAAARIVLRRPDVYGPGLVQWARLVLGQPQPSAADEQQ